MDRDPQLDQWTGTGLGTGLGTALVALFSLLLLEVRRGSSSKWLLALPVLMVIWVNLHGGFLVGFILIGIFAADASIRWIRALCAAGIGSSASSSTSRSANA